MTDGAVNRKQPWLFEAYPRLAGRVPWTPLVEAPTPVERLENVGKRLGVEVWIKRDDKTSPVYGGNKPRKLEFLLADARVRGRTTLVTCGGLGTNHGLATTIHGREHGFRVVLGLRTQPVDDHVRDKLRLFHAYGATMILLSGGTDAYERFEAEQQVERPETYFIPAGGSNPVGALGFVDAGLELARQVGRRELPLPRTIFMATGTCGTLAGLVLGLRLAGLATRVIGVQVASPRFANPGVALELAQASLRLLRDRDPSVPDVPLSVADFRLDTDHFGPGYGHPTDSARDAVALVQEAEGITLDLTYTGKAFGALSDHVNARRADGPMARVSSPKSELAEVGPILFWNTFNSADLSGIADGVDSHSLPDPFHRFFDPPPLKRDG